MYIPSYMSFDESKDDIQILQEDDNICVICWLPSEKNNKIKYMKDFSNICYFCDCNVLIHIDCFNEWLIKCPNSPSCPICRTKITIFSSNYTPNYIKGLFISCLIIVFNCTYCLLRVATFAYLFNIFCLFMYNFYMIYFINHYYEYYDSLDSLDSTNPNYNLDHVL
jgi:hypothetical protein